MAAKAKAFTLMEMVIVIGLIAVSTAILLPYTLSQISRSNVSNAADNLESLVFLQQQRAYSHYQDQSYGIYFDANDIYLYKGESYASAIETDRVDFDSTVGIASVSLNSGGRDINFPKGSFRPSAFGTVEISKDGSNYQVVINSEGLIDVYKV